MPLDGRRCTAQKSYLCSLNIHLDGGGASAAQIVVDARRPESVLVVGVDSSVPSSRDEHHSDFTRTLRQRACDRYGLPTWELAPDIFVEHWAEHGVRLERVIALELRPEFRKLHERVAVRCASVHDNFIEL